MGARPDADPTMFSKKKETRDGHETWTHNGAAAGPHTALPDHASAVPPRRHHLHGCRGFFSEPVATLAPFKPVGVTFAPDGRIFIWQRDGVIRIVKNGALLPTPFLNFSNKVNTYTDRGFLGVALDPNFAANGWVYVFYTYETTGNPNDPIPKKTGHLSSSDRRSDQSRRDAGQ